MEGRRIIFEVKTKESTEDVVNVPETSLADMKRDKEKEIRGKGAVLMLQTTSPYSAEERDTWPTQVAEAHAYQADSNATTPLLAALCVQRGNTVGDQVARILANEAAFKIAVGQILGIQQAKIDQIQAATTVEEVNAIMWEG